MRKTVHQIDHGDALQKHICTVCAAHSSCLLQEHPLEEPMLGKVSRSLQMEVYREVDLALLFFFFFNSKKETDIKGFNIIKNCLVKLQNVVNMNITK